MPLVSTRRLGWSSRRNGLLFHSFVSVPPFLSYPLAIPSPSSLSLSLCSRSLRPHVAPIHRYRVMERQRIQALSFFCAKASLSLSLLFRASSPSLASWRHLWLNRLRGVGIRPAWIVAHVGVLVCEFRGIVSVEHFPAWIGTRGIGSLGARMDRDPLCSRLNPRRALSARVVSLRRPWLFRLWATRNRDLFFDAPPSERYIRDPSSMCRFKLRAIEFTDRILRRIKVLFKLGGLIE